MTYDWFKMKRFILLLAGVVMMGQSCSISFGSGQAGDGGVFRSVDHGQTWQHRVFVRQEKKRTVTVADASVRTLVFEPGSSEHLYLGTRESGIWHTTDAGAHWLPTSLRTGDYQCLDFDPLNHRIMYTAAGSTVLKSLDAGQSWGVVYTESQPVNILTCVAVDPLNGRFVWAFTSGGKVLRSDDYGQTWTLQTVLPAFEPRLIRVLPNDSGDILVFTKTAGIFRGDHHGSTWTPLKGNLDEVSGSTDIRSVALHSSGWYIATAGGLLRSTDDGQTWTAIHTLVTAGSIAVQNVAVHPRTGQDIFITVGQKLHHTTDGGASWSVTTLPTTRIPVTLMFDPSRDDILYLGTFKPVK